MDLVIRDTVPGDSAAIHAIYAHHVETGLASFEEAPPDRAEMERRFADLGGHGLPCLTATVDGRIAGYAYAAPYRTRSAYRFSVEDSIYLDPAFARRGIGRRLLDELVIRTTRLGLRQMIAVIGDSDNTASIGLHSACGFAPAGVLRSVGFKHGRWVDSVLMQRPLGAGDATLP